MRFPTIPNNRSCSDTQNSWLPTFRPLQLGYRACLHFSFSWRSTPLQAFLQIWSPDLGFATSLLCTLDGGTLQASGQKGTSLSPFSTGFCVSLPEFSGPNPTTLGPRIYLHFLPIKILGSCGLLGCFKGSPFKMPLLSHSNVPEPD